MRPTLLTLISGLALLACNNDPVDDDTVGRFEVTVANIGGDYPILKSGVFDTPVGADALRAIEPGEVYIVPFTAAPGDRLSMATMFVQSNDLFYALPPEGLPLFDENDMPISGDITSFVSLYDAGTEVNQEPGEGEDQAPRQALPTSGDPEDFSIREIADGELGPNGFVYPDARDVILVSLSSDGGTGFELSIENVSDDQTLQTTSGSVAVPLSPGAWAVHDDRFQLFTPGETADAALEDLAEAGNPGPIADTMGTLTGVTVPLSPLLHVVHSEDIQLFQQDATAGPELERLAEDGDANPLLDLLQANPNVTEAAIQPSPMLGEGEPLFPDEQWQFEVSLKPNERFSMATMYVASNDLFYAFEPSGIDLFEELTTNQLEGRLVLWDAGTEVNQEPGVGLDQPAYQSAPGEGEAENGAVRPVDVDGGWDYLEGEPHIEVTIVRKP